MTARAITAGSRNRAAAEFRTRSKKFCERITGERVITHASGRTDTGVHALGQVVTFQTREKHSLEIWQKAIAWVSAARYCRLEHRRNALSFHPRRSAKLKRYRYLWCDGPIPEVFAQAVSYTSSAGR